MMYGWLCARLGGQFIAGRVWFLLMVMLLGSGCASMPAEPHTPGVDAATADAPDIEPTVVAYRDYRDPLIVINRGIFAFNDVTYRYVLIPLSQGYLNVVPQPVRNSIGNFFYNIKTPIYAVNHLLQLKLKPAGINLLRFCINTTLGIVGLFDPAASWFALERAETHFEDTLAGYGAGYGIYLVLPLFGPSDVRNGASILVDQLLNPIPHLTDRPESTVIQGFDYFQETAPELDRYLILRRKSDDPYIFFRNLHLQGIQRDADY